MSRANDFQITGQIATVGTGKPQEFNDVDADGGNVMRLHDQTHRTRRDADGCSINFNKVTGLH